MSRVSTPIYIVEPPERQRFTFQPSLRTIDDTAAVHGDGGRGKRRSCEIERHLLIINPGIIEPKILNNLGRDSDKHRPLLRQQNEGEV